MKPWIPAILLALLLCGCAASGTASPETVPPAEPTLRETAPSTEPVLRETVPAITQPETQPSVLPELTAEPAEAFWFSDPAADAFVAEVDPESALGTPVLLRTNTLLTDVAVVELEYNPDALCLEVTDTLLEVGYWPADTPLVLRLVFYGSIPCRGIQFTHQGITQTFALEISGYDGALLLTALDA